MGEVMMRYLVIFLLSVFMIGCSSNDHKKQKHVIDESKTPKLLYVISALSGSVDDETLTLNDISTVIYFSDRPSRIAGNITLEAFVEKWDKGTNSFEVDPPNAVLSIFSEKENKNVVVELSNPKVEGKTITFSYKVLKDNAPKTFEEASLFIDLYDPDMSKHF